MLQIFVQLSSISGAIVGLILLAKALMEYSKQGTMKRAEHFMAMRKRLKEDPRLSNTIKLIKKNDPTLIDVEFEDKLYLTGFFEEIALLMNSNLLKPEVAHYMFGYYAIRCWENDLFWKGLNRNTPYWSILRDFVEEMKKTESEFKEKKIKYTL